MTGNENGSKALTIREGERPDLASLYALAKTNPASRTVEKMAKTRRMVARRFLTWAGKRVEDITPQDVEAFRSEMEVQGYAKSTQYQRVSLLSQFFEYAVAQGLIDFNPVPKGEWRKAFRPKPYGGETVKALSAEEVKAFFEAIDRETVGGARLFAMCRLMLETGMRAAEVGDIRWKNTRLANGIPTIRTKVKGGDWETFEITDEARADILHYLALSGRKPRGDQALFASIPKRKKGGKRHQPLSPIYLWYQVKRIAGKVGLEMSPHTFRHTFAQLYHESGASQPEVQGALGHKSGDATRIYLDHLAPRSRKAGKAIQQMLKGLEEER